MVYHCYKTDSSAFEVLLDLHHKCNMREVSVSVTRSNNLEIISCSFLEHTMLSKQKEFHLDSTIYYFIKNNKKNPIHIPKLSSAEAHAVSVQS